MNPPRDLKPLEGHLHFGNPLALKHLGKLEDFEVVVCAYQGFEEVQGEWLPKPSKGSKSLGELVDMNFKV